MALQFRRGTDAERQNITPKSGEPVYTTDTGRLYVGDGSTQGGQLLSANLIDDENPFLGGDLNLNNNNIIGTGNINITGNIDATGYINAKGNINLGDGAEDNIIVGGVIGSSLIPDSDGIYDLGDSLSAWRNGYFEGIQVDGEITANNIVTNSIFLSDSSALFDSVTSTIFAENIIADNLFGNLYAEGSTLIVDTENATFNGDVVGSIFAENGDLLIDSDTFDINAASLTNSLFFSGPNNPNFTFDTQDSGQELLFLNLISNKESNIRFNISDVGTTFSNDEKIGQLEFKATDIGGEDFAGILLVRKSEFVISVGDFTEARTFKIDRNTGNYGLGIEPGDNKVLVGGDIKATGFLQLGSYTETERDALSAENGMVLYNTTANKFQGYENGSWINLI